MTTIAPPSPPQLLVVPVTDRDHAEGPRDAAVTIVEYGDFECPYCASAASLLRDLRKELKDALRLVYRHFPLWDVHPHAEKAAEAAEAAGAQGLFWEMHRRLFARQDLLDEECLVRSARKVGLDMKRFQKEMQESFHAPRVRADWLAGQRSGVTTTPTVFINGELYRGRLEFGEIVAHLTRIGDTESRAR
jgi:formate-nitrite transporter family protein